jgi:hypothetical protein
MSNSGYGVFSLSVRIVTTLIGSESSLAFYGRVSSMSASVPASHLDLLTGPVYAVFTTIADNGQPENTVV